MQQDRDEMLKNPNGLMNIDDEGVSLIDVSFFDEKLKASDIVNIFETKIGPIDSQETFDNIGKYLPKVFAYEAEHRGIYIPEEFKQVAYQINDRKSLLHFISAKFLPEGERSNRTRQRLATIWKVFYAFYHAHEEKGYFDRIDEAEEVFQKDFDDLFETEKSDNRKKPNKKYFKNRSGKKIYVELAKHDTKAKWRVIDKLLTKATLNFSDIKDILRGRIVLKNEKDKKDFDLFLKGTGVLTKYGLSLKTKYDNPNAGAGREGEIKYINRNGKENEHLVPTEISIMTKKKFHESESHEDHHLVYEFIQNLVRDDRLTDLNDYSQRLSPESISEEIYKLANNKEIREKLSKKEITERIYERFWETFFIHNESYYSYQNTLRCRHKELRYRHKEILEAMFAEFNKKKGLSFSFKQWQDILDDPQNANLIKHQEILDTLHTIKGVSPKIAERVQEEVASRLKG